MAWRLLLKGYRVSGLSDEKVLEMDNVDVYKIL